MTSNSYLQAHNLEESTKTVASVTLNPWVVQNIIYDALNTYMRDNPPKSRGFQFENVYSEDPKKSDIYLAIGNTWDVAAANKRPSVVVGRGNPSYGYPTLNYTIGMNVQEGETRKAAFVTMPIFVSCIVPRANGFVEAFAEYVKYPLLAYQHQIKNEFCLQKLRLSGSSPAQLIKESIGFDAHIIIHQLEAGFVEGIELKEDSLKLKTVYPSFEAGI